jgi:hypothetical protein
VEFPHPLPPLAVLVTREVRDTMKEKTLMGKYMQSIVPHNGNHSAVSFLDTTLREFIGKTDNINVGKCSHNAILERERDAEGKNPEHYCRCCGMYLNVDGVGRCNDFLILRHEKCRGPICFDCMTKRPDVFYRAYREGLEHYEEFLDASFSIRNAADEINETLDSIVQK